MGICFALLAAVPAFADPSISSKRAEAAQVMSQLRDLSDQLERARSQYDASTAQLAKIQGDLRENRRELKIAPSPMLRRIFAMARRFTPRNARPVTA